jgi:hypothetical protein
MIDVQMTEQNEVEIGDLGAALGEPLEGPAADIHQDARLSLDENQVAGAGAAARVGHRPAGAKHHNGQMPLHQIDRRHSPWPFGTRLHRPCDGNCKQHGDNGRDIPSK